MTNSPSKIFIEGKSLKMAMSGKLSPASIERLKAAEIIKPIDRLNGGLLTGLKNNAENSKFKITDDPTKPNSILVSDKTININPNTSYGIPLASAHENNELSMALKPNYNANNAFILRNDLTNKREGNHISTEVLRREKELYDRLKSVYPETEEFSKFNKFYQDTRIPNGEYDIMNMMKSRRDSRQLDKNIAKYKGIVKPLGNGEFEVSTIEFPGTTKYKNGKKVSRIETDPHTNTTHEYHYNKYGDVVKTIRTDNNTNDKQVFVRNPITREMEYLVT